MRDKFQKFFGSGQSWNCVTAIQLDDPFSKRTKTLRTSGAFECVCLPCIFSYHIFEQKISLWYLRFGHDKDCIERNLSHLRTVKGRQ